MIVNNRYFVVLLLFFMALACQKEVITDGEISEYDTVPYKLSYGTTLPPPPLPVDNFMSESKVQLGRMLFYETLLSGDNTMSCASCHRQENAFADPTTFSVGIDGLNGKRNAMAIVNMAWNSNGFFWDGRAKLLRNQALLPIQDVLEMHETLPNVVEKLEKRIAYKMQFKKAFGNFEINETKISLALESFMQTLVSGNSKYDQVKNGLASFTPSEQRGKDLFFTEYNPAFPALSGADCAHCHGGANFENDHFENNGLDIEAEILDGGRMNVTNLASDKGRFKVPTLRNIAVTGPYMHDGRFASLEEVVEHYNSGIKTSSTLHPALANTQATGLMLTTEDKTDLVNFLKTLTDYNFLTDPRFKSPF